MSMTKTRVSVLMMSVFLLAAGCSGPHSETKRGAAIGGTAGAAAGAIIGHDLGGAAIGGLAGAAVGGLIGNIDEHDR